MTASFQGAARPCAPARATLLRAAVFTLAPLALALPSQAQQTPGKRLDQVVVTASRMPQRLGDVLADLTVIGRAEIERQAFGSVADLLRNAGCAELVRNGGPASNTTLFLRGADSRHTVVLLDGVRIDSQSTGGASWQAIPLANVERVEVLKGPASAIYGSDAVAGVVHIISRKGDGKSAAPRLELGAAYGSLSSFKADAAISGGTAQFDYMLSLATDESKGFNATTQQSTFSYVPDVDGWSNYSSTLRLGGTVASGHRVELLAVAAHTDGQYDGSSSRPTVDDHAIQDNRALRASWAAQWSDALRTELSVGEGRDRYETTPSPYLTETTLRNVALLGSYRFSATQQLNFQLERSEDRLLNSGLRAGGNDQRSQNAAGLGWLYQGQRFDLQAHARHDDYSEFGGVSTGTLAGGFKLLDGLRAYASLGNAFRAPTLYQRGSIYGPDLSKPGVAALNPERGRNRELGLRWDGGSYEIGATAYLNKISNLIVFGAAGSCSSGFGCYQNVARAELKGLSLSGSAQLGIVRLSGTLDFSSPKDAATGLLLARRAERHGTLRAETTLGNWLLGAAVQASGQRWDNAGNTRKLAGYGLANFDVQYRISPQLRLQANLDNAFDREYQTAYGYQQAPRTLFVGLRFTPAN